LLREWAKLLFLHRQDMHLIGKVRSQDLALACNRTLRAARGES
jgi:hypothetical protein